MNKTVITRHLVIANVLSGWAVVPVQTVRKQSRDEHGRFTSKELHLEQLPATFWRSSSLTAACNQLKAIGKYAHSSRTYLGCPKDFVKAKITEALGGGEIVEYIPKAEIQHMSSPMGLAFNLARAAYTDEFCPEQDVVYKVTKDTAQFIKEVNN